MEWLLVLDRLFAEMEKHASYFNTEFTAFDWVTSYFYNFMVWLAITWVFHKMHPVLSGNHLVKSLKVYALMYVFFASVSAVYMNHYRHPKAFYLYNLLDALIVFPLVAIANGLLYPRILGGGRPGDADSGKK